MNLKYRGISYEYKTSPVEFSQAEDSLLFRGQSYCLKKAMNIAMVESKLSGTFLGKPLKTHQLALVNP